MFYLDFRETSCPAAELAFRLPCSARMEKSLPKVPSRTHSDRTAASPNALPANSGVRWALGFALLEAACLLLFYLRAH